MKKTFTILSISLFLLFLIPFGSVTAQRKMEKLGRGVVVIRTSTTETLVSWRLLGTEPSDIGFNLYRSSNGGAAVKLNSTVLLAGTNYKDGTASFATSNAYFVKPVLNGVEQAASVAYTLPAYTPVQSYFNVPIHYTPGYAAKFIWVGDLDGDGEYDFVFDKQPTDASKYILLEAYKQDGTFLWQLNCGPNSVNKNGISPGSTTLDIGHGDNFTVYDINNDGKSEVIVRTGGGVTFGDGSVLSESNINKQYISVLNGMTGAEISRTPYNNPYLSVGPMNGHMGIAYLDGINPSVVWEAKNRNADNSFNEMTSAWSWVNGNITQTWQFLTGNQNCPAGHQIRVADLDGDGKDEVEPMGFAIDDDGTKLWSLGEKGYVHGDRFYVGDLDPSRPGLEGYAIQQMNPYGMAWVYFDAKTGEFLNGQTKFPATDLGRGVVGDFDPRYKGYEFFTFTDAMYNVSGAKTITLQGSYSYPNMRIWWDGDLGSENLDNKKMIKWNYLNNYEERMFIDGNSTFPNVNIVGPNTPGFCGDILGDWREEVVFEAGDGNSLVVYTTPYTTNTRIYTLPHNPEYRNSMCVKGYYQANMLDYYLGYEMSEPPVPSIQTANKYWKGTSLIWDNSSTNWTNGTSNAAFANGDTIMFDISGNGSDTIKLNSDLSPARIWAMNPEGKNYIFSGSGKLTGSMDLIKSQTGVFTLCGKHDYSGQTRISQGKLVINGSLESKVLIQARGNLGGIGTLNGGILLEKGDNIEGGRLSPGNGILASQLGTLTINGDLAVTGNNNFAFDIIPGSAKINDSLLVKGNLTISGVNKLVLNFVAPPVSGTYTLIKCLGTLTADASNFVVEGLTGVPKSIIIENNEIKIQIASVRTPKSTIWKGSIDNVWNYDKANFNSNSVSTAFVPNDSLLFDESALQKTVSLTEVATVSKLTFDATSDYTIGGTGVIAGTGDLIKMNTNTLNIQLDNNTYTGKTIVEGGTLSIATIGSAGKPSSIGSAAATSGNITLNGASLIINENSVTDRGMNLTGNIILTTPTANKYAVFGGVIAGAGSLIKDGPGQLAFIGRNSYSGGTILRNGSITLGSSEANESGLGTGSITLENGNLNLADARNNAQLRWNIIVPAGGKGSIIFDGRSSASGSLTGDGTLTITMPYVRSDLSGNWSAFTGRINTNGDFRINNNFGYANAAINLVTGWAYSTSGGAVSFGELSGAAGTTLSGATWTVGAKNTDAIFSGKIQGNSLTKVGTGMLTLNDTCFYTANTTVNAGTLSLNTKGCIKGTLVVNNGGIVSGTGSVLGSISVNSGAIIQPGTTTLGTLKVGTSLVLNSTSTTIIRLNKTAKQQDSIRVKGVTLFGGTLNLTLTSGAFGIGDSVRVIKSATYSSKFNAIVPETPGNGLQWDQSTIAKDGYIRIVSSTGINDTWANNILLLPNPVKDVLTIQLESAVIKGRIKLLSVGGNLLFNKEIDGMSKVTVNMSSFASGFYMLIIDNGETVKKFKVLKN